MYRTGDAASCGISRRSGIPGSPQRLLSFPRLILHSSPACSCSSGWIPPFSGLCCPTRSQTWKDCISAPNGSTKMERLPLPRAPRPGVGLRIGSYIVCSVILLKFSLLFQASTPTPTRALFLRAEYLVACLDCRLQLSWSILFHHKARLKVKIWGEMPEILFGLPLAFFFFLLHLRDL